MKRLFGFGSKQEDPDPPKSGYVGDLSNAQQACLDQVKEWIITEEIEDPETLNFEDHDYLRFCRARNFDLAKVKIMLTNYIQWRRDNNVDDIIENQDFPEEVELQKLNPIGMHKTDKLGRPVYYDNIGFADFDKVFRIAPPEKIVNRGLVYLYETTLQWRLKACRAAYGKHIETTLTIMDLNNKSVNITNSQIYQLVKMSTQVSSDYYPETMGQTFAINCPFAIKGVWAVVKGFLDEKTRSKVRILGNDYMDTILEFVNIEDLPERYGGQCRCEGGCLNRLPGPWDDYEIHGKGIRLKSEGLMALE